MLLEGHKALITGAGRGIGREIALAFAEEGCDIAAIARTESELEETCAEICDLGRLALAISCDVTDPDAVEVTVDGVLEMFGDIDILVNNAGYAGFKPFEELDLAEWQQTLDVNLTAPFLFAQAVVPSMKERGTGRIINISSVTGLKPIMHQSAYCASKFGLNGLTQSLALELREHGIGVHTICPGGVDTQLSQEVMPDRDKSDWLTPEDVAHTALFLASLSPRAAVDNITLRRFGSTPL